MIIVEIGHIYDLYTKQGKFQRLTFFRDLPHNREGHDGVLCQEVIRALIDRVITLNNQKPCHESVDIIIKLREVLILFETRAARGTLEKSYAKIGKFVEELPTLQNGHIFDLEKQ